MRSQRGTYSLIKEILNEKQEISCLISNFLKEIEERHHSMDIILDNIRRLSAEIRNGRGNGKGYREDYEDAQ